jgi:hypothetical protein
MNLQLNESYSLEEVKVALFQMFPTKAPGPDGFPVHLFQKHSNLYSDQIMKIVIRILNGENSQEEINKTFIVLIPKIQNPSMWCIKLPQKYLQIV